MKRGNMLLCFVAEGQHQLWLFCLPATLTQLWSLPPSPAKEAHTVTQFDTPGGISDTFEVRAMHLHPLQV